MDKKDLNLQVPKWFVLKTYPRREKIVEQRLSIEGIEVYLPKSLIKRDWSDRVKLVEIPLVPSLVFVFCPPLKIGILEMTKGVVEVMREGESYIEMAPSTIRALQEFSAIAKYGRLVDESIIDSVMGREWKRREGDVIKVDDDYYYLYLPELDKMLCVEINRE